MEDVGEDKKILRTTTKTFKSAPIPNRKFKFIIIKNFKYFKKKVHMTNLEPNYRKTRRMNNDSDNDNDYSEICMTFDPSEEIT